MVDTIDVVHILHPHRATIDRALAELSPPRRVVVWTDPTELLAQLGEVEALVASVPPRGIWAGAQRLRLLHLAGVGAEMLLPAPDLPAGVRIACARGLFAAEVAEHVVAVMLALVRGLPRLAEQQRRHQWLRHEAGRVAGKTLGILGLGTIGTRIARVGRALGMRVIATRRGAEAASGQDVADEVFGPAGTREVLGSADVVVVTLPSTPQTRGLLDATALGWCRPGAVLINVARGGLVDEAALLDALEHGRLGGAALDVFEREPLAADSPLWAAPNLLVTPHAAGYGRDYATRLLTRVFDNLGRLEAGDPLMGEVDRVAGY